MQHTFLKLLHCISSSK